MCQPPSSQQYFWTRTGWVLSETNFPHNFSALLPSFNLAPQVQLVRLNDLQILLVEKPIADDEIVLLVLFLNHLLHRIFCVCHLQLVYLLFRLPKEVLLVLIAVEAFNAVLQ